MSEGLTVAYSGMAVFRKSQKSRLESDEDVLKRTMTQDVR